MPQRRGRGAQVVCAVIFIFMLLETNARSEAPLEEIVVTGEKNKIVMRIVELPELAGPEADVAALMTRVPGGNVAANGPLTGLIQYRGFSGVRLAASVDGVHLALAGPNLMGPPLHYVPLPLLQEFEVVRGVAPVSDGGSIGGVVRARLKKSSFGVSSDFESHIDAMMRVRSVDDGMAGGGMASFANNKHRLHVLGSVEDGDDARFPGGKVLPTSYRRSVAGVGYGMRVGNGEVGIDYRHQETGNAGTPSLPMDIRYFDAEIGKAEIRHPIGAWNLSGKLTLSRIKHGMDNFTLRSAPAGPASHRYTVAVSDGFGFDISAHTRLWSGDFLTSIEGNLDTHDVRITNPNNAMFFVNNYSNVKRHRLSAMSEWAGQLSGGWGVTAGVRLTRNRMTPGDVDLSPMMPMPAQMQKNWFNSNNRSQKDINVEAALIATRSMTPSLDLILALGKKVRSPGYVERFSWLPMSASGGLADGNNYIGDPTLKPERLYQFEVGFNFEHPRFTLSPRFFVQNIDDYVQGVPFDNTVGFIDSPVEMISAMGGDPTPLRFANVDARLWGFDVEARAVLGKHLKVRSVFSYVRGKRRDIDDDLYRIAPTSGLATLTYERSGWQIDLESRFAFAQRNISLANGETETAGYALLGARARFDVRHGLQLALSADNLTNKRYANHLSGRTRVPSDGLAMYERMPGVGRNVSLTLMMQY